MNNNQPTTQEKKFKNLIKGTGINLLPQLTNEQVVLEKRKISININAAIAILILVVFSIIIFGFNAISKLTLNQTKSQLYRVENDINLRMDILSSNDEILRRVKLYQEIEKTTVSSKSVVDYWNSISKGLASIQSIEISKGLSFAVAGQSTSLDDVSKLWYLLGNDKRIAKVDLKTIVKDKNIVRFNFEGELNFSEFAKNKDGEPAE